MAEQDRLIVERMLQNPAALFAFLRGDLENALVAATPGGIEAQEARGQRDFVAGETLPKECIGCTREQLETMGIIFGEDAADLFVKVQLPEGWKKVPTDHSMWSHLVDERGRKRASIYYKAAFYDRDAHIGLEQRFSLHCQSATNKEYGSYDNDAEPLVCIVTDCGEEIWRSAPIVPTEEIPWYRLDDLLRKQGLEWLNEHYPEWKDPLVYWD